MKKIFVIIVVMLFSFTACAIAADKKQSEPNQLFYDANHDYQAREYLKAVEGYVDVLAMGLESGNLYYNMGNGFLKLGKLGHAILCYEKAKRIIPHDSDLKANLAYARSLVEGAADQSVGNIVMKAVNTIFGEYSLREIIFSGTILYLIVIVLLGASIARPFLAQRIKIVLWVMIMLFTVNLIGIGSRYFDERILRRGVVTQKEVECKYEPIEKSTTYYTLHEGADVLILKTREGWRQIRRADGKVAWVKKESVEEI